MGRRTNPRLAQSKPPPGKGFRGVDRERQSVGLHCLGAAAHQEISLTLTQCFFDTIQLFRFRFRHSENTLSIPETSHHWINAANLSKDDIRWAQAELHYSGLYNGSLDGVMGPETKQALAEFQEDNGLKRTARLDQRTADALIGDIGGIGQGSSLPPRNAGAGPMTSSSGTSDSGGHGG